MQCIVAGTGYTGARLFDALAHSVGVNRHQPDEFSSREFLVRDLDQNSIEPIELPARAAMVYSIPPSTNEARSTRLQRLLSAIQPALQRVVYLSTTGVYGDQQGKLTNESAALSAVNTRAKRRLTDEQALRNYATRHDCEVVILRIPGIYGPGRLGISRIRDQTEFIAEADANPGNRIHVEDLVSCCIAALAPGIPSGTYNVGDGDHSSSIAFANCVARLSGLPLPPTVSRAAAEATFSELRLSFLRESRTLDTTKMREVLGVVPRYGNMEDGIKASLS